ncbi:hypothetical protein P154DRAFT_556935 [Amniculicola lignicola CBS 123094]|uniref:Transposase Tc1-like domain-containing protein n=1 Tax=Amniculicola lignicola CBS 123094 TaxID=1392246 RepID=A0A6A5WBU2_9PLEO|nr:hypothetical protein P154DRAFT_556935 [Amniculicola lignicola CBS 123094]
MARIDRWKPYKYKVHKQKQNLTKRRESTAVERAFNSTANVVGISQSGVSRLVERVKERAEASGLSIDDPSLYDNDFGRAHREKNSRQAIKDGDSKAIMDSISVSTFENVMYEAGYSRKAPGFRPPLTEDEKQKRYKWALAHNPDLHEIGDNKGFNFRRVVYTDETPARAGDQRGIKRSWCCEGEEYHQDVKRAKIRPVCTLQFYGAFTYNENGPCHIYRKETNEMKHKAGIALKKDNEKRQQDCEVAVNAARRVLRSMNDLSIEQLPTSQRLLLITLLSPLLRSSHGQVTPQILMQMSMPGPGFELILLRTLSLLAVRKSAVGNSSLSGRSSHKSSSTDGLTMCPIL